MDNPIHPLENMKEIKHKNLNVEIRELTGLAIVFAQKGQEKKLMEQIGGNANAGQASIAKGMTIIPLAPEQWMIVSKTEKTIDEVNRQIENIGYLSQQSASRVCVRVSGPLALEFMSRGCQLDLHPSVISLGYCAQTIMAQVGTTIHFVDDKPSFDIYVYAGFAQSFWKWIEETAKQFIVEK